MIEVVVYLTVITDKSLERGCCFITSPRDVIFKNFPLVINSAPKVKAFSIYFDEDFI